MVLIIMFGGLVPRHVRTTAALFALGKLPA